MRILFGVNGEGMGHAMRSKAILDELIKNHEIKVVAGGRACVFLGKSFDVSRIGYLRIIYRNNSASYFLTFFRNMLLFPFIVFYNLRLIKIMFKFKPETVITDFEPFTCYLALIFGKKLISIDNQHITNTKIELREIIEKLIVKIFIPKANYYLVTTFFYPPVIKKNTYLFPPINRKEILKAKPKEENFILVYQTSKSNKKLVSILKTINHRFIISGFDKKGIEGNITFRKPDEKQFIKDLKNCKAVITNGGFTLVGEALYLGKPILSLPVKRQFEQKLNAYYLDKLGYGKYCKETTKEDIWEFISNIERYKKNLMKYKREDNSRIIKKIKEIIRQ